MRVLGFSVGHDKGAVIIENGKVVVGITQERLIKNKT
jgi:predicted NodU family carbamoyl transferase